MPVPYQEVVELIINNAKFSQGLKVAQDDFYKFKQTVATYKFNLNISDSEARSLAMKQANEYKAAQIKAQKEIDKAKEDSDKKAAERIKFNITYESKLREAQFLERKSRDELLAREEYEIAKALHQYRLSGIREEYEIAKALHQYRNAPAAPSQGRSGVSFNAPQATRVAAGLAVATGNYQVGGGLYAAANMLNSSGLSAKALQLSTTAAVGLGVAVAGVAAAAGVLFYGRGFNEELAKMSTLLADANVPAKEFEETLDRTAEAAVRVSNKFNFELVDVVKGFKDALSSGIEARDLERFMDVAGTLSTSLGTGLAESTNILTTFKDTYELTIGDLASINDYLFNSVDVGKVTVNEMTKNLGRLVPVAHQAGLSLKDIFVGVDVLTRQGQSTSTAITSITQFITAMVSPTDKAAKLFDELGIAWGDAAFKGKKIVDVFKELKEKTGGSSSLLGDLFPEIRAKRGASGGIQSIGALLDEVSAGLDKTGTAATASARAMDTLWTNLGKVATKFSNIISLAGSKGAGILNEAIFGNASEEETAQQNYINRMVGRLNKGLSREEITGQLFNEFQQDNPRGFTDTTGAKVYDKFQELLDKATKQFEAGGRDAGKAYITSMGKELDALSAELSSTIKEVTGTLTLEDPSKLEAKVLGHNMSDEQKEEIDNLKLMNEELQEQIALKQKAMMVSAESNDAAKDAMNKIDAARQNLIKTEDKGNPFEIAQAKRALESAYKVYHDVIAAIMNDLKNLNGAEGIVDKFNENVLRIQEIRRQAMELPEGNRQAANDIFKGVEKWEEKQREEKKKSAKHWVDVFSKAAEEIAKKDLASYKAVMKEKEDLLSKSNGRIDKLKDNQSKITQDLWGRNFDAKVTGSDPDRNRRAAVEERDNLKSQLEAAIAGGATMEMFNQLADRFKQAMEAVAANTQDPDRAKKNMQEDLSVLGALSQSYTNKGISAEQQYQSEINRTYRPGMKSAEQLAKEATKKADETIQVEKVRLDAEINLQVDGTVSKETLDTISASVLEKLQSAMSSKTLPSKYDSATRDKNSVAPEEDY